MNFDALNFVHNFNFNDTTIFSICGFHFAFFVNNM